MACKLRQLITSGCKLVDRLRNFECFDGYSSTNNKLLKVTCKNIMVAVVRLYKNFDINNFRVKTINIRSKTGDEKAKLTQL